MLWLFLILVPCLPQDIRSLRGYTSYVHERSCWDQMRAKMKFISLILSLGVTTVFALNNPIACLGAIESAVSNFRFLHEASTCSGNLSVHSLWAAANVYCTPEEIAAGSASLRPLCYGDELIHYSEIQPDLTNEYVHSLPVVNFEDIQQKKVWHTAVLLSPELYAIGLQSEVNPSSPVYRRSLES